MASPAPPRQSAAATSDGPARNTEDLCGRPQLILRGRRFGIRRLIRESGVSQHPVERFVRGQRKTVERLEKPPIPSTATRSPALAGAFRRALNVVRPAHRSGAASADDILSGIDILAFAIITSAYPPS